MSVDNEAADLDLLVASPENDNTVEDGNVKIYWNYFLYYTSFLEAFHNIVYQKHQLNESYFWHTDQAYWP